MAHSHDRAEYDLPSWSQPTPLAGDDVLVYIHIPKTGGTSLIRILDSQFAPREIFPVHSPPEAVRRGGVPLGPPHQYRFVRGHFRFGPFDNSIYRFVSQNPLLITVMRDPIERTISAYRHILRSPDHELYHEFSERHVSLSDFVTLPEYANRILNQQSRVIAGSFAKNGRDWATRDKEKQSILRRLGFEKLDQFALVGITEQLVETVKVILWKFSFVYDKEMPVLNAAPTPSKKEDLTSTELQAVSAANEVDIDLYEYARERFQTLWTKLQEARLMD